jgi:hypothetical protein
VEESIDSSSSSRGEGPPLDDADVTAEQQTVDGTVSGNLGSPNIILYSVNPLFKGLEYESAVLCTSLHGIFIQIFSSVEEASDCFQIDEELVRKICHGMAKKTLGISLRYASEEELEAALAWKDQQHQMLARPTAPAAALGGEVLARPGQWHVQEAWKLCKPETKSQTRKRLQKEVHACFEVQFQIV